MPKKTKKLKKKVVAVAKDVPVVKKKIGRPKNPSKTPFGRRPPKFSPEIFAKIVALARAGWPLEGVAKMVGINQDTIHDWRKRFPSFSEDLEDARTYFDEHGSNALGFLMQKQKLKKRKITKTIDENGKEITKTEITEEEIAPNATVVTHHAGRRFPNYSSQEGSTAAKSAFIAAFEQWTNNGAIERYKDQELPGRASIRQAADEPIPEPSEDKRLGRGSPFG